MKVFFWWLYYLRSRRFLGAEIFFVLREAVGESNYFVNILIHILTYQRLTYY